MEKMTAKQRYDKSMEESEELNPIERLRFFLACALNGQDWLDVEPFIDAVEIHKNPLSDAEILKNYQNSFDWDNKGLWAFNFKKFAESIEKAHGIG
jgi:hypothetical protein